MSLTRWTKRPAIIVAVAIALATRGVTVDTADFSTQRVDRAGASVDTRRPSPHVPGSAVMAFVRRVPMIMAQQVLEWILRESYDLRRLPRSPESTDVRKHPWRVLSDLSQFPMQIPHGDRALQS